jgi:hypothetical protein
MSTVAILAALLEGSHSVIHEDADSLTESEWALPALPGSNAIGYTLWHLARTYDWAVNTAVRAVPEVISRPSWMARPGFTTPGIGTGMSAAEALEQARSVQKTDVLAYLDDVHASAMVWLREQDDSILDGVPDLEANQAPYEVYRSQGHLQEVHDLFGLPAWAFLLRPCGTHVRAHHGEVAILKQVMRSSQKD